MATSLVPGSRLMLVQRSSQDTTATAAQVKTLSRVRSVAPVQFGVVARLGRDHPSDIRAWMAASGGALKIADPESWTRGDEHAETSSTHVSRYPHLRLPQGAHGSAEQRAWLDAVYAVQANAGATVILTPGLWVGPTGTVQRELALVSEMIARVTGEPVWLNVAVHHSHVIDPIARQALIAELLSAGIGQEGRPEAVYLRAQLPSYAPSYTEPRRKLFPEGMVDLVASLSDAGVPVVLPNLGLTGWLMLGFGAQGFGAGVGWAQRAWLEPGGGRPGPGRYFHPDLLHSTTAVTYLALQRQLPSGSQCACRWCRSLWAKGRRAMPDVWDYELGGQHYLQRLAQLTANLPAADLRPHMLGLVTAAAARAAVIKRLASNPLAGVMPTHLKIWDRLLR